MEDKERMLRWTGRCLEDHCAVRGRGVVGFITAVRPSCFISSHDNDLHTRKKQHRIEKGIRIVSIGRGGKAKGKNKEAFTCHGRPICSPGRVQLCFRRRCDGKTHSGSEDTTQHSCEDEDDDD